ncbi:hypothetical protein MtrunA17_Chr4g0076911 [Medicago truncatula]|uniref:Uncharacterized protein n=1 Tax=Medicago truncatula TaxID=3880 RepID=A0A396IHS8_MEDTR|nr:hypothetical protein MtrunA17_Chr4g0076911 [Medicago truncatula]
MTQLQKEKQSVNNQIENENQKLDSLGERTDNTDIRNIDDLIL